MHVQSPFRKKNLLLVSLVFTTISTYGQGNATFNQFSSEIQFNGTINKKWATEFDLVTAYTSMPNSANIFNENYQKSYSGWLHYYFSPRWKFSAAISYYDNKYAPDIGQFAAPEWRFSLETTHFFHKIGYNLSARSRVELRNIKNIQEEFEQVFRFRERIKFIKPINSQILRKGIFYAFVSDEFFIKSNSRVTGIRFLDKNTLNLGGGYLITDDLQAELFYANDYIPRDASYTINNIISIKISYNNLIKKVVKSLKKELKTLKDNNP